MNFFIVYLQNFPPVFTILGHYFYALVSLSAMMNHICVLFLIFTVPTGLLYFVYKSIRYFVVFQSHFISFSPEEELPRIQEFLYFCNKTF
ncbi:hypothetical protein C0J52_22320 [Blattella germanica]|nr:hypothetical protein C0J52_22320 [Blattella germanica]